MLTVVAMLSAENVLFRPGGGGGDQSLTHKAAQAHRRFASYEGDLPTLKNIYEAWCKEAIYTPANEGGPRSSSNRNGSGGKVLHGQVWSRHCSLDSFVCNSTSVFFLIEMIPIFALLLAVFHSGVRVISLMAGL